METIEAAPAAAREEILLRTRDIHDMATLPASFLHIVRTIRNPNASVQRIARVLEADQAISMRILKVINAPFYGLSRSIDSVHKAIVLLGANTLENVVLSASTLQAQKDKNENSLFDRTAFWQHSIACGLIVRYLGTHLNYKQLEEGFIGGIIHDIGKVILDQYFPAELHEVIHYVQNHRVSFRRAEREVLGTDHTEIGALLAESWNLPENLVEIIGRHHSFNPKSKCASSIALVQLADMLARQYQFGSGGDQVVPKVDKGVWRQLQLDPDKIAAWESEIKAEVSKNDEFAHLVNG